MFLANDNCSHLAIQIREIKVNYKNKKNSGHDTNNINAKVYIPTLLKKKQQKKTATECQ